MNPATGTFTQEDTYQGNIYDALSLHKYLYAQDNPVIYRDPTGNMCTLVEAVVSAGQWAMGKLSVLWAAIKAIRILKSASIITDVIDIKTCITEIISSDNRLDKIYNIGKIVFAVIDIISIITGKQILPENLDKLLNYAAFRDDIESIINSFKKGETIKAIMDILVLIKDLLLLYAEREIKGNKKAFVDLTKEAHQNGRINKDIKNILYSWAKEYKCVLDYFGELFYLW